MLRLKGVIPATLWLGLCEEFAVNNLHSWLKTQGMLSELEESVA